MTSSTRSRVRLLALPLLTVASLSAVASVAAPSPAPPEESSTESPPIAPSGVADEAAQNLILNGDFESNTFSDGCHWNLLNFQVTAGLANLIAFGTAAEIDVMKRDDNCGFLGPPQSGRTKLAIHRQPEGSVDAFAFELSHPVMVGKTYEITFYAWMFTATIPPPYADVEIGLSNDPASFGTLVFSGTPGIDEWQLLTGTFEAPMDAMYLTVQVATTGESWNNIDNFSLQRVAPVQTGQASWGRVKVLYR